MIFPDARLLGVCALVCALVSGGCENATVAGEGADRRTADGEHSDLRTGGALENAQLARARIALANGDLQEASGALRPDEWRGEDAAEGWRLLGRIAFAQGRLAEAGAAYDRALALRSDDAELWADIARLRYRGGEHMQSLDALDRALSIDPANPSARLFEALIVRDVDGPNGALPRLRRLAAQFGDVAALEYAATLIDAGQAREAASIIQGMGGEADRLRAIIAARGGNWRLARDFLSRALRGRDATASELLLSGLVDLELGFDDAAAQSFDVLLRRQPGNRLAGRLLALALYRAGAYRELTDRFAATNDTYLQTLVGRSHEAMGKRDLAAPYLDAAVEVRSTVLESIAEPFADHGHTGIRGEVVAAMHAGRSFDAVRLAQGYLDANEGSADAQRLLGDAQLFAGRFADAARSFELAARVRLDWPLVVRLIAAYQGDAQKGRIEPILRAFAVSGRRERKAFTLYARYLHRAGRFGTAARMLDLAIEGGGRDDPAVMALRSHIAADANDPNAARHAWSAYRLAPSHPEAVRAMADHSPDPQVRERMVTRLAKSLG